MKKNNLTKDQTRSALSSQNSKSSVDRIYDRVKSLIINYQLRPDEQLNEVELANSLGVSRTPLREVLNRLVAEKLLNFVPRRGFFNRQLAPQSIYDLFEVRGGIESIGIRLATERATDEEIEDLINFWEKVCAESKSHAPADLVSLDEEFHIRIITLSRNSELLRILKNVNDRLHYLRFIYMEKAERREGTYTQHTAILAAFKQRDAESASRLMLEHIENRTELLVEVLKEGVSRMYINGSSWIAHK
jgi:DNA-binding GntR family transcriptional regulator